MFNPNVFKPGFPNLQFPSPLKIPTTLSPVSQAPPQPQGMGSRISGILSALLGAQDGQELNKGLIDFGARMMAASSPGGPTFLGALGQSLPGTQGALQQGRQLSALDAVMDPRFRGLPPQVQMQMLMAQQAPYSLGPGEGRYQGNEMVAQNEMPRGVLTTNLGNGDVAIVDRSTGDVIRRIQGGAPESPRELQWETQGENGRILRGLDPVTGEEVVRYDVEELPDALKGMDPATRTEYLSWIREFNKDTSEARQIGTAVEKLVNTNDNQAGDISLVFAYMKLLDPGSTVREGEQATVNNSGNIDQRVTGLYNRLLTEKGRMPDDLREQFKQEGLNIARGYVDSTEETIRQYEERARALGMRPDIIVGDNPLYDIRNILGGTSRIAR